MMKVLALKNHSYAGRKRRAGETYEVDDRHVPILQTARVASPVEGTPMMESGEPKPKRRYKRRDMRAET